MYGCMVKSTSVYGWNTGKGGGGGGGGVCSGWDCILIWLQDRKWVGGGGVVVGDVTGYVQMQSEVCIPLCAVAGA